MKAALRLRRVLAGSGLFALLLAGQAIQVAQAAIVQLRYDGVARAFADSALPIEGNLATLATDSGLNVSGDVNLSVLLTVDTAAPAVGLGPGWSRYFDAIQSATLVFGNLSMTMTREATAEGGLGQDNTLDMSSSPYIARHTAGLYAYQGGSGAFRVVAPPTASASRADFGYVWRDFYAVLDHLAFDSPRLTDLPGMLGTALSITSPTNGFHVGIDFRNPNQVAAQYGGGGNLYTQIGSTVSFNGRMERLSLVPAATGGGGTNGVPEPSSMALLAVALAAATAAGSRRKA